MPAMKMRSILLVSVLLAAAPLAVSAAETADLIVHNGKIVSVDDGFSIHEAMAVKNGQILAVGDDSEILKYRGNSTEAIDLAGRMAMPGIIDTHGHPTGAAMTEFDHPVPTMESIEDILNYVKSRADALEDGQWIFVSQVFITRLKVQRYPTREELDRAAPKNPVAFRTGPDASLNTLALQLSGIDKDFEITDGGPGKIERDPKTGEPTGILRGCNRYIKYESPEKSPTEEDRYNRLRALFADYNSVGITGACDGAASESNNERYRRMLENSDLTLRVWSQQYIDTIGDLGEILEKIAAVAKDPLYGDDPMLRIIGVKVFLDGGMLTGSAYMRKPWGVSEMYAIDDPEYRGVLFIPHERLTPMVRAAVENNLQFNAHTVGDGAVHALLAAYEEVNQSIPIRKTRSTIIHSNFMSRESVEKCAELGVVPLIQPAWLYLDARTLQEQFGYERLRYFQPLKSLYEAGVMTAGGADHMQKIGSMRSINPYNPFLGMWVTVTRKAKWYDGQLHPEEALTREQAIRFYTINAAFAMHADKELGSLEPGKRADFIVLNTDLLTCPEDAIRDAKVLKTYVDGKCVYSAE